MKTSVLVLLAFTTLAGPALAQSAAPPSGQSQAAPAAPVAPPAQMNPQPQPGAMMCGMMGSGQQAHGQPSGGCPCCRGMTGHQSQRQGAMPMMDHSRMAQMHHGQGHGTSPGASAQDHAATNAAQPTDTPATKAFRDANARMHRDMDIRYTNDVDVDFARSMIPHHQGAIDMARVVLEHSKEPETRKLAEDVIKAQEAEIAHLRAFLKRKGVE